MLLQSVSDWHMFHVYQFHSLIDFVINIVTAYLPLTHSIYSIHTVLLAILLLNLEQTTSDNVKKQVTHDAMLK